MYIPNVRKWSLEFIFQNCVKTHAKVHPTNQFAEVSEPILAFLHFCKPIKSRVVIPLITEYKTEDLC